MTWREPHMIQAFLPEVMEGDKRIVFVDGEVAGAINRLPGAGEIRSNLAAGGSAEKTELSAAEEEICAAIGPELKARGLLFVGIDVIGGKVVDRDQRDVPDGHRRDRPLQRLPTPPARIWDAIEAKL
jgi:glutathione synthase